MKYLTSTPDILDGTLCVRGTRIPIDEVLYLLQEGESLDEINSMYSWVDKDVLRAAVTEALGEAMTLLAAKYHAGVNGFISTSFSSMSSCHTGVSSRSSTNASM